MSPVHGWQESYATGHAAQLAHAVERNSSALFAQVIGKYGPVAISGAYLSVSVVQVPALFCCCVLPSLCACTLLGRSSSQQVK